MIKNFILVTLRTVLRNKTFAIINILGLSLGMACSLLIILWVQDEAGMDHFHKNTENIYQLYEREFTDGKVNGGPWTQGILANELKRRVPEIRYASGFDGDMSVTFGVGEKFITMKGAAADSDFFKIFDYTFLTGHPASILTNPDEIVISRTMADNFFGSPSAAINKSIRYNDSRDFRISAVYEDVPRNSSDQFDFIVNWQFHLDHVGWLKEWIYRTPKTYVALVPGTDPAKIENRIKNFLDDYIKRTGSGGYHLELGLQRFDRSYLYSNYKNGFPDGGRIEYVHLFSLVAVFILLIAGINFMNLSTARSVKRAKEVGIRKTIGARRFWLIAQFIGEAVLFTFIAILIALLLVICLLPAFNSITGKHIILPASQVSFWSMLVVLALVMGFGAGSYPALFLSSLNPVTVLKGSLKFSFNAILFRKGLVVFQFALSIILIIGTMVISKQINFVQTQSLGINKENLIYVPFQGDMARQKYGVFKQQLAGMPGIKAISRADQFPTDIHAHAYDMQWEGKDPNEKTVVLHTTVGYDYLKFMNLALLQGRDFSESFASDNFEDTVSRSPGIIINETALKVTGYKDPIGKRLGLFGRTGKIIGVVKDFHFQSLHDPIEPLVILLTDNLDWGNALIRTEPGKTKEALSSIAKVYAQLEPKFPFKYSFADEEYQKLYENEELLVNLSTIFSILAIFISCLGLLGLAMFTVEQRTKEIGIRKVLGATEFMIFRLLSKDFIQLVGIAFVVAAPVSWLVMDHWLSGYAYRTNIGFALFALAGATTGLIALLTISIQTARVAFANPVKSIRTE